ncbi:MAG: hypothetical protein BWY48_00504 [Parcubacteria group bacterium ADurb.Bin305]|nr:MAG: hypothetical protein BWY48_00504 [Parcubacteria group bacterium ADurb.Bin305]
MNEVKRLILICLILIGLLFNSNTLTLAIAPPPPKLKWGYLVLVPTEQDKVLYKTYLEERKEEYDIRIISLEERKTPNVPAKIHELIKTIYYQDFKPKRKTFMVSDLKWVALDEKINSEEKWKVGGYRFVDEYKIYPSFISRTSVQRKWTALESVRVEIALPFLRYPYPRACCYQFDPIDLSISGKKIQDLLKSLNINHISLYETRSSKQPKYKPTYPLTKTNFINQTFSNKSNIVFTANTWEIIKRNEEISLHNNLVTSIWTDKNGDRKVDPGDPNQEITLEDFYDFTDCDNIKRIIVLDNRILNVDSLVNCFYAGVMTDNSFLWSEGSGPDPLLYSRSLVDSASDLFQYNRAVAELEGDLVFGPPETNISDL